MSYEDEVFDEELREKIEEALKRTAIRLYNEIIDAYDHAITEFYNNYTPKSYNRTFSLYQANTAWDGWEYGGKGYREIYGSRVRDKKNGIINKIQKNKSNIIAWSAGITIDPNFIKTPTPYRKKGFKTFNDTKINEYIFNRSYSYGIHGMYPKDKWHYGNIDQSLIPRMQPKRPARLMREAFRKLDTQRHVNKIMDEEIKKLL